MKRIISLFIIMLSLLPYLSAKPNDKIVKLKIVQTSDVHGNFFPFDFINYKPGEGSLARAYTYIEEQRKTYGDNLILLDNGDILQGQPSVYYYNFIDTTSVHLCADILNFMGYTAGNMGNHDIETGHEVYDRWVKDCKFPVLGANIIDTKTGNTYLKPYTIIERNGVKVAILGMITPAIPAWLAENLWAGLRFDDMVECARKWMQVIQEKEKPDVVIGMFHSGRDASRTVGSWVENASLEVAKNVPGFDIVLMGHDHQPFCQKVENIEGHSVYALNPGGNINQISDITITIEKKKKKNNVKSVEPSLVSLKDMEVSSAFMAKFHKQFSDIQQFVSQKIGTITYSINTRPAYFGPSPFIDFIHTLQLGISGAEISFAAPLSFDATIKAGDIRMSDMFNLYKFENMLYVMELTGQEIKDYLEFSYNLWCNQMTSPDDHLLLFKEIPGRGLAFANPSYNFDSAAGINYSVDVSKPYGERITIHNLTNGMPFLMKRTYRVALNSYRGNGGGEHLTKGAGIPQERLTDRIVYASDRDLRYYMMEYIRSKGTLTPKSLNQWRFKPEKWVQEAAKRDFKLLFP